MKLAIATLIVTSCQFGSTRVYAQAGAAGPGTVEISLIPGGGTFFPERGTETSFGNYNLGGSITYNINPWVGIEGEAGGTLGVSQNLTFGAVSGSVKTPNMATYSGNVVISASRSSVVPYATGGVGGLTLLETPGLGIGAMKTFLTGNVGGGVKWFANKHWGLRADYRFLLVQSKDDAPAFFGRETRYGHRVYGAIVVNAGR
jgi:hypothetical protein